MQLRENKFITILVEDNDDHAELLEQCLEPELISEIQRFSDGEKAIRFLRDCSPLPDLVILDLNLPRVSGHEVLAFLKNDARLQRIPVVVFTTSGSDEDRTRAYLSHVNSYLLKPTDFDQFQETVNEICNYWRQLNCPAPDTRGTS